MFWRVLVFFVIGLQASASPYMAQMFRAHSAAAPANICSGKSIGQTCTGSTGLYAGTLNGYTYMVTPGHCTNSSTPTCSGATDTVKLAYTSAGSKTTGATSASDGLADSAILATFSSNDAAAIFCRSMDYGGFQDWYLPASSELDMLYTNRTAIGGFASNVYWSATESTSTKASTENLNTQAVTNTNKSTTEFVRCVRRIDPPATCSGCTAPTLLSMSQTANSKNFTVSWSAGTGVGTCSLQYDTGAGWATIISSTTLDCNSAASNTSETLNGAIFANWGGTSIRLVRNSDATVIGTFTQTLACSSKSASVGTATPTIDEDCDGQWDNSVGSTCYASPSSVTIGAAWSCAATISCSGGTGTFSYAYFGKASNGRKIYNDSGCTSYVTTDNPSVISAIQMTNSGTVPNQDYVGTMANGACDSTNKFAYVPFTSWDTAIAQSYCDYTGPTYYY